MQVKQCDNFVNTKRIGRTAFFYTCVDSTNNILRQMAQKGLEEGAVVIAEEQSAGRGRLGRTWNSQKGLGLWMSVLFYPTQHTLAALMPMMLAVSVCSSLRCLLELDILIKWPNDIIGGKKKAAGMLCEMLSLGDGSCAVIGGIGINVSQKNEDYPLEIRQKAVSLAELTGAEVDRLELLKKILVDLDEQYERLCDGRIDELRTNYRRLCLTLHQAVRIESENECYHAWAEDIDAHGALIINRKGERKTLLAGDVSVRGLNGYVDDEDRIPLQ